tara:strand:+ start:892 stop:2733 length:1842 start_codon:yes stop_codon:yes gene_type:complete
MAEEESLFTKITGFDDAKDMFDGGGKGGSGDQFYGGTNKEYTTAGGTNKNKDDNVVDRFLNTVSNENNLDYKNDTNKAKEITSTGSQDSSSGSTDTTGEEVVAEESGISKENVFKMFENSGLIQQQEDLNALVADPQKFLEDRNAKLSDIVPNINPDAAGVLLNPNNPNYALGELSNYTVQTINGVPKLVAPQQGTLGSLNTASAVDRLSGNQFQVDAAQGELSEGAIIDASDFTIDTKGVGTGVNVDGTANQTGIALNDFARLNTSQIIDTSTAAGKLTAMALGEGNYIDSKSTILGQQAILAKDFVGPNGESVIPAWAKPLEASMTTNLALNNMTGTQRTETYAKAILEASLGFAEKEAKFFQTVDLENLKNEQASLLQKQLVLSKVDLANLDAQETASVNNAKTTLTLDVENLNNEQQAEVLNTAAYTTALFDLTSAENLNRRVVFETESDRDKFYDNLTFQAAKYQQDAVLQTKRFNAGEINDASEFRQTLENRRQEFESTMAHMIDRDNATWRRTVETENTRMAFDAASMDVKNTIDITQEGLNRIWNNVDTMLDYEYKAAATEEEFELRVLLAEMQAASGDSGGGLFSSLLDAATTLGSAYISTKFA